jgi:hypothetical protein
MTIREAGLPANDLKKIDATIKETINRIPPITSHFQATASIPDRIRTGIFCTINPKIFLLRGSFEPKTSKENINIKRIARIVKILGIQ